MKAIIDSSVLVSAFLTRDGVCGLLVKAGLDRRFEMLVFDQNLAETTRRLRNRPKLSDRYGYKDDDHVIAAALAADCIISGDRDLLELGSYQRVSMRTVGETLDALP